MENEDIKRLRNDLEECREIREEFEMILDYTFDFISIADHRGVYLRISKGSEKFFGVQESDIVGHSAYMIQERGIVKESVTVKVLKTKEKYTAIQKTNTGIRFMVIGIPMFGENGELKKIINISRDVTERENLNRRLIETEELLAWYRDEVYRKQEMEKNFVAGETKVMQRISLVMKQAAGVNVTVLLQGETGVGKSFIAKTIHAMSHRRDKPFIQVNCGAIPDTLLESELFGYVKGAFTGASTEGKKGYFEIATGGTLFLDEIAEIPLHLQVKLLHALEEQQIYKIGSSEATLIDVRIIAATNKDLTRMVSKGEFREDLYYRLNILPIVIPSLRERVADIPLFIHYFVKKYNEKHCMNKHLTIEAHQILKHHQWKGNVRELENMIERLLITATEDEINAKHVHLNIGDDESEKKIEVRGLMPLKEGIKEVENRLILMAYKKYKTTRKISEVLKIDQSTVAKKLKVLKDDIEESTQK